MKLSTLTVSIKVINHLGALMRILQTFVRRGYNLHSVIVSPAHNNRFSRLTIVAEGEHNTNKSQQIVAQLNKLVDVEHAFNHQAHQVIHRELVLFKVHAEIARRREIFDIIQNFEGKVLTMTDKVIHVEFTGDTEKIDSIEMMLQHLGILEMVRSGPLVMLKGEEQT